MGEITVQIPSWLGWLVGVWVVFSILDSLTAIVKHYLEARIAQEKAKHG